MSMSDTAEYWSDIKSNRSQLRFGNQFRHIKGVDCGHRHSSETIYIEDVTCHACKRLLEVSQLDFMKSGKAPETYYMSISARKEFNKRKRFIEQYGICQCGCDWAIRINKSTNERFLGCTNYPKCKNSKTIKNNGIRK